MKKRFLGLGMLSAFLLAAPALAQNVDQKIQALEQELLQLKEQQIELKKEATEAAAAMPSFSYRPGNGLNIEAADKSWSFRPTIETHFRMLFEEGRDQVGRTNGEIMGRRFRPGFFFCINNCLWELEATFDMDGFGTGNAKNSTGDDCRLHTATRRCKRPFGKPQSIHADRAAWHGSFGQHEHCAPGLRRGRRAG